MADAESSGQLGNAKKQSSGFGTNDKITGPVLTDEKQRKCDCRESFGEEENGMLLARSFNPCRGLSR
jgi:hypothetical protein